MKSEHRDRGPQQPVWLVFGLRQEESPAQGKVFGMKSEMPGTSSVHLNMLLIFIQSKMRSQF